MRIIDIPYLNITGPDCELENVHSQFVGTVTHIMLKEPCRVSEGSNTTRGSVADWFLIHISAARFTQLLQPNRPCGAFTEH